MSTSILHLSVVTPARTVLEADAESVVVPAFDGELGVLPGHAAMLALLGPGILRLTTAEGQAKRLAVRGGFLQVDRNQVTVLTPESMDAAEAKPGALAAEAEKLAAEKPVQLEERAALAGKQAWLKVRQRLTQN
jgi:F-type H+-transporting ATPase subunit epsilon